MTTASFVRLGLTILVLAGGVVLFRFVTSYEKPRSPDTGANARELAGGSATASHDPSVRSGSHVAASVEVTSKSPSGSLAKEGAPNTEKGAVNSSELAHLEGAGQASVSGPGGNDVSGDRDTSAANPFAARIRDTLEKSSYPAAAATVERDREMQNEPNDEWSQDVQARLRSFVAQQPETRSLELAIACSTTQCEMLIADPIPNGVGPAVSPSQALLQRLQQQPWYGELLEHSQSYMMLSQGHQLQVVFLNRINPP